MVGPPSPPVGGKPGGKGVPVGPSGGIDGVSPPPGMITGGGGVIVSPGISMIGVNSGVGNG